MSMLLSDKAYSIIKKKINQCDGQYLSVRKLSKEINIGYSPVREACNRLSQEGLIKQLPGIGYYVPKVKEKYFTEVFEYRRLVGCYVFEQIFSSLTKEHVDILSEYNENMIKYLKKKDIQNFHKYDKKFHLLFFHLYNNSIFINQMNNIMDRSYYCSYKTVDSVDKNKNINAIEEHKEIIKYIVLHDKEMAIRKYIEHMDNNEARIKEGYINRLEKSLLI
ncbi:MAG: GntR family transcriptional regulator [Atribacterota bacterium]|nr:GntR family transcriptional regulator [Atribacterota bacterium]MDD4896611.1 GntR family transcriptional regulator [Atribacterota bacterium]MDD5636920.1 GntR family transcriptional regulator [Atribacterota bacterium]